MNKNHIYAIFFLLILSITSLFAKGDKVFEEFKKQLDSIGLEWTQPADFIPVELDESKREDVDYFYALKHKSKKFEVRYSIFEYRKSIKEPGHVEIGSDNSHQMFTTVVVENIAGDEKNILIFQKMKVDEVKKKYNADHGYVAVVKPESNFGKGYTRAMIIGLYKSGFGFSYHTILFDNDGDTSLNIEPIVYSVRFKDKK